MSMWENMTREVPFRYFIIGGKAQKRGSGWNFWAITTNPQKAVEASKRQGKPISHIGYLVGNGKLKLTTLDTDNRQKLMGAFT